MLSAELSSSVAPSMILLPHTDAFALRAARLRKLATGHSLGQWLVWLADVCDAQQAVLATWTPTDSGNPLHWPAQSFTAGEKLLACLPVAHSARSIALSNAAWQARAETVLRFARNEMSGEARDLADVLVGAALQVVASASAPVALAANAVPMAEQCPCCGGVAVGSLIYAGEQKAGLRYQECCLCGTRWNTVRAHCTLCQESREVEYSHFAQYPAVIAETCAACQGYTKTFFQSRDIGVDPYADDLATLALDVLVGENGYSRATPNLLLCEGEWN